MIEVKLHGSVPLRARKVTCLPSFSKMETKILANVLALHHSDCDISSNIQEEGYLNIDLQLEGSRKLITVMNSLMFMKCKKKQLGVCVWCFASVEQ